MINVLFDTTPLTNEHAHRGVGQYTGRLLEYLKKSSKVGILTPDQIGTKDKQKIDLIHYPYFDLFSHTLPFIKPAPHTLVTIHDVIPLQFPEAYKPGKRGKLALLVQSASLSRVDGIITDSVSSKDSINHKLNVPMDKINVVYLAGNPLLQHQPESIQDLVRATNKLPAKYLLYVGDINYNKNLPQLIKSLKYLDDDLCLVCFGKNFYPHQIPEWQWIETQLALSNVEPRVHFLTEFSEELNLPFETQLGALYSAATMYIQPSLAEGFGLPVLEAMQCKTPVVATNLTSLPEVGGSHATYCSPDANSIAEAVKKVLMKSKAERTNDLRRAKSWSEQFNWQKTADETIAIYQSIVKR